MADIIQFPKRAGLPPETESDISTPKRVKREGKGGFTHENPVNQTVQWYTPAWIFEALNLRFDLDPCSPGAGVVPWVPADKHYTERDNGLIQPWFGKVWMNCPYGRETPVWVSKFAAHGNGVALLFSRTDTKWFERLSTKEALVCFVKKRIPFVKQDGTKGNQPACGSILVAYGEECCDGLRASDLGKCWRLEG